MNEIDAIRYTLEQKDPISTFEYISECYDINYDLSCHIIAALVAIDTVLSHHAENITHLYVQDDSSILWMLNKIPNYSLDIDQFKRALEGLDFSKLIYRFSCARKFLLPSAQTRQLRINSWGRHYWEIELINKYQNIYQQFYTMFAEYYNQHKQIYSTLVQYLSADISPQISYKIQNLNRNIDVKLLA